MATQKSLVGTKTQVNLANAYVAESCAYSRYTFFAQAAQKESYFQYANILNETAANELRHAKIFLRYLDEANCKTDRIGVDAGVIGKTLDNLKVAAEEERVEGVDAYTKSAKVAEEEGFTAMPGMRLHLRGHYAAQEVPCVRPSVSALHARGDQLLSLRRQRQQ